MKMKSLIGALLLCSMPLAHAAYLGGSQNSLSTASTSVSVSYTCHSTSGTVIVMWVMYFHHSAVTVTPSNTDGFTWNQVIASDNVASYGGMRAYYAMCTSTSPDTMKATFSGSGVSYPAIGVIEESGLTGTPYVTGEYAFADLSGTTGNYSASNSNSSGNTPALSGNPALIVGVTFDTNGTSSSGLWSAGTGFTARQTMQSAGSSSQVDGLFEDKQVSSDSAVAATFTATTSASTVAPVTAAIVFHEPSAGGTCTGEGITSSGALAVPNGSGSYLGKSGAFVTPDCSTVQYFHPIGGGASVN